MINNDFNFSFFFKKNFTISRENLGPNFEVDTKDFKVFTSPFADSNGYTEGVYNVYKEGLWPTVEEYVQKYMEMSKNKTFRYLGGGTSSTCYRVGDFVIKLDSSKWSYDDPICPSLFLINKSYDEVFIRDERTGYVIAGIEVQRYLERKIDASSYKYLELFLKELEKLGYISLDSIDWPADLQNVGLLDNFLDADFDNPEKLPDWFKRYPIVLLDRDRVYKIERIRDRCGLF